MPVLPGSSTGDIFVFKVEEHDSIELSQTKQFHSCAISCMAASADVLAAADDGGAISLWNAASMTREAEIEGFE
jgi:hypothetical protein